MIQRNTLQRNLVLEMVRKLKCHATAEEVYEGVVANYPNISKTTVYRNLKELADAGEIRRLEVPGGADHYDHICENHYHIRCVKCGKVVDVDMDFIKNLQNSIKNSHGFIVDGYDLMFKGICEECQKIKGE
ncbi:MAG: transcriptional repressor [Firmicutes bacterium]|nr:transcriptional repressor [Bacillota bacterium]